MVRSFLVSAVALLAIPLPVAALEVVHDPAIDCLPVGHYSLVKANVTPASEVASVRFFLRVAGTTDWFSIDMRAIDPSTADTHLFEGVLPKPTKVLEGKVVTYYLEAEAIAGTPTRTQDFEVRIVRETESCKKRAPIAPWTVPGGVQVFPDIPPGFGVGAPVAVIVSAAVGAGAGATGVVVSADATAETAVVGVEFYARDLSGDAFILIGWDAKSPYRVTFTPASCGPFEIVARAIDVANQSALSAPVLLNLGSCH
ncbi:MAG: hypothetical protein ACREI8_13640 [Myxococcota bacterium]